MAQYEFVLGFKALAELIPDIVGEPLEAEYHNSENGDALQQTTRGLLVWRKLSNWTAYTDGFRTWINGPFGLQERLNGERFDWELGAVRDIADQLALVPANGLETRDLADIVMLVVHWDGGPSAFPEAYDPIAYYQWEARYHVAKDWGDGARGHGLMYHEKISRGGRAWIVRPAEHVVWAARYANPVGYMICIDANEQSPPTEAQRANLRARLKANRARFHLTRSQVFGHGELTAYGNQTSCPGPDLLALVQGYREGR